METPNRYQDTFERMEELFCEEAASLLTEEQMEQTMKSEKDILQFAEQHQIPISSWMGNNLRRYCKDLLRRQQPFFILYYLLGVCTEASIVLFLCYGIYYLLHSGFPGLSFSGVPGIVLIWFCSSTWNRSSVRRQLQNHSVPKNVHKIFHLLLPALIVSLGSMLLWSFLLPLYRSLHLQSTFLLCAALLFLSGIHNVLYSSHTITFITVGLLRCSKKPATQMQNTISRYLDSRSAAILAEQKKTAAQMQSDPKLYAEIHMAIRSRLVTYRIYLLFAILLLLAFDILCIYQSLHTHTTSLSLAGSFTALVIAFLVLCVISCNEIIRSLTRP